MKNVILNSLFNMIVEGTEDVPILEPKKEKEPEVAPESTNVLEHRFITFDEHFRGIVG